jgi:transposase
MKKRDGRKIPREAMEYMRIQAIRLFKEGKRADEIAEFFGVTVDATYKWKRKHKEEGIEGLRRKKAKGKVPTLNESDKLQIISFLKKPATEFGFETQLWTCKRVQQVIKQELGKSISISNLWNTLRKWRLSPQIPQKEYAEKDKKKVDKWLREEWPKIKAHCRRWQAMLYFQDESGISLTPVVGRTWAPVGETPKIKVTGKRGGFCISSAISPAGKMAFRIEKKRINAKVFVDFLMQIIRQHPHRKIIVVCDNARPHIAKYVKEFELSNKKKIAIYHIPSYSPELNPDEEVWNYLKNVKLKDHLARNKEELKPLAVSKLRSIQKDSRIINSFFMKSILT